MGIQQAAGPKVLVIDPSAHIRRLIATLMMAVPVTQVAQCRTAEAADAMAMDGVQLVILDWTGDAIDQTLFVHRLRRGEFGDATVPVLALSPSSHHAVLERAWDNGVDEVVAKPISAMELIERTRLMLAQRGFADGLGLGLALAAE
jgi:DNA-binding response OmpR family regulator